MPESTVAENLLLKILNDKDIRAIDRATRDILSTHGIQLADDEGLDIFESVNCEVDRKTKTVRIPSHVIDESLEKAPKKFFLYGRRNDRTVTQEHMGSVHYTTYGPCIRISKYLGYGRYESRDSTDLDLEKIARLCDWADNVSYLTIPVSASDWADKGCKDIHELITSISNTTKHFQYVEPLEEHVNYYWEILKAYYRGDEKLARERPIFSMMVCPTSPLKFSHNASQVIIKCARCGIPINVLSMAMAGASSPIHLAGTLVTQNAEVLAGIALSQIVNPGAKVWYGSSSTAFDPRYGTAAIGSPELGMISTAVIQLGQYYKLPTCGAGMLTDSKVLDSQSAHERTLSSILSSISGANAIYGLGTLELGLSFSLEQLVIDNEIVRMEKQILKGITVNEDTLFTETIKNMDPSSSFLEHHSTVDNMDLISETTLFDRSMIGDWQRKGSRHVEDIAHEVVMNVLKTHQVDPIPDDIMVSMKKIMDEADKKFLKEKREIYGE